MKKQLIIIVCALLPLCLMAQGQPSDAPTYYQQPAQEAPQRAHVFTGFSGGMMLHAGYMFSDSPDKLFSNTGLGSYDYYKGLPKDGACFGLGGALRVHLINHIHLGAEGGVSTMPLMKTGSNVRTGWGGALCDFYTDWGKTRPLFGLSVGGGTMKRLYVPDSEVITVPDGADSTNYNSSYVKTPFFFMDPYIGLEITLNSHMALLIRIDYMLAFGRTNSSLTSLSQDVKWSNFMTPSGPRLYVGIMFGKLEKK